MLLLFGVILCLMVTTVVIVTGNNDTVFMSMVFAFSMFTVASIAVTTETCTITVHDNGIEASSGCDINADLNVQQEKE